MSLIHFSLVDHTIGNLLRIQLLRDPSVRYSGYRMPHPLIFDTHIRIETQDAKFTPVQAFESALEDLKLETDILTDKFKDAMEEFEAARDFA
ncbi:hypothetical protein EON65_38015 [archaeon]|nr:MAG: hypothetical protein EON65_38015 [archaeon]